MPSSQRMTEYVVFHLKEGVNLENIASSNPNPAAQAFLQSTNTVKAQPGFIRQFWGHEVEHPNLFVWTIEWESLQNLTAFLNSQEHTSFKASLNQVFDLDTSPPITLYTRVTDHEGATAALRSPVTEVAFYRMPARPTEAEQTEIEEGSAPVLRDVQEIGKASGAAIGFVFDGTPQDAVNGANPIAIIGVFGYASITVHMAWRETPEGKQYGQEGEDMEPATVVPGIDPNTGYFHVVFHEGS